VFLKHQSLSEFQAGLTTANQNNILNTSNRLATATLKNTLCTSSGIGDRHPE
jgi:hypothetical protein